MGLRERVDLRGLPKVEGHAPSWPSSFTKGTTERAPPPGFQEGAILAPYAWPITSRRRPMMRAAWNSIRARSVPSMRRRTFGSVPE